MVGVSGEVEDHVRNNLRHFIHEVDGEELFSAKEILTLVVRLFSHVREEGPSGNDWLRVGKLASGFRGRARAILQIKLPFFDFVGEVLNEASQWGVILRILRQVEQLLVGGFPAALNLLRYMVLN